MNELKEEFSLNGLLFSLLKRNDVMALYGIYADLTDKILHYEVDVIYIRKDRFGEREHSAKNDDFGRDRSRCYARKDSANKYFEKLTTELRKDRNLSQGVGKVIAGVQEKVSSVSEFSLA